MVRHDVVRAVRAHRLEPDVRQRPQQEVPLPLVHRREVPVVRVREPEREGPRDLERVGRAHGEEVVDPLHRVRDRLRGDRPAHPPSRDAVRLREAVDRDRPLRHGAEGRDREVGLPAIEDVLVDLVRDRERVPILHEVRDQLELLAGEHLPRRVVRRVQDDRLRPRGERALQGLLVDLPGGPGHRHELRLRTAHDRIGAIVLVERFRDHDLVPGVHDAEHRGHHRLRGSARDDDVRLRVRVDPVEPLRLRGDRVPEGLGAPRDRVLLIGPSKSLAGGLDDLLRRVEVREPLGEVDRAVLRGDAGHLPNHALREVLDAVRDPAVLDPESEGRCPPRFLRHGPSAAAGPWRPGGRTCRGTRSPAGILLRVAA